MPNQNVILAPGKVAAITADASGGTLDRKANQPGGGSDLSTETVPASVVVYKGPFTTQTRWRFPSTFSYTVSDAEYLAKVDGSVDLDAGETVDSTDTVVYFDDFIKKAFDETNENWILNSGSDDLAVDPAIVIAEGGTAFLDAGDGDGTIAADGSQLVWAIPMQADSGGLFCEARVKIEDISEVSVNVGFTDVTTLEEPFSISGTTVTSVASNAVAFCFDDGATTKEWYMCGVDGDTDATGIAATGTAPADDTYQTLRVEVDSDGEGAEFFINGTSVGKLTASVVGASTNLYFTCVVCGDGSNAAAVGLTVDWVRFGHNR